MKFTKNFHFFWLPVQLVYNCTNCTNSKVPNIMINWPLILIINFQNFFYLPHSFRLDQSWVLIPTFKKILKWQARCLIVHVSKNSDHPIYFWDFDFSTANFGCGSPIYVLSAAIIQGNLPGPGLFTYLFSKKHIAALTNMHSFKYSFEKLNSQFKPYTNP